MRKNKSPSRTKSGGRAAVKQIPTIPVTKPIRLRGAWRQLRIRWAVRQIRRAAKRIDPYSARMVWWGAETLDPYGLRDDLAAEEHQLGRECFLADPKRKWAVTVDDVQALHPEIHDEEWKELMVAARKRDTSVDPFGAFHRYGGATRLPDDLAEELERSRNSPAVKKFRKSVVGKHPDRSASNRPPDNEEG
jgi:hypothetical protein